MSYVVKADGSVEDVEGAVRPAECMCLKTLGFASCQRGHGYCPFLDPGHRHGSRWRKLLGEQVRFYRKYEPWRRLNTIVVPRPGQDKEG